MADSPRIVAFAGSTREGSFNRRLLRIAVQAARAAGADVLTIDLRDLALPLYDGDFESAHGLPQTARRFKQLLADADALLIASPEYNSSVSAVLKNAIDWASRPEPDEPPLIAFRGKMAALMSASTGYFGGWRGLTQLRWILSNIGVLVLPTMVTVPNADKAFDADGTFTDPKRHAAIQDLAASLVALARQRS